MKIVDLLVVRLALSALLAFKAIDAFFATALTLAYRLNILRVARDLGQLTAGDDYTRLIPLMDAVPWWLHGLWVLAGLLYLVAIALALLGIGRAQLPILAALGLEITARLLGDPIIAATGIVVNPHPSLLATVCIPYLLPLLLAVALSRQTPRSAVPAS